MVKMLKLWHFSVQIRLWLSTSGKVFDFPWLTIRNWSSNIKFQIRNLSFFFYFSHHVTNAVPHNSQRIWPGTFFIKPAWTYPQISAFSLFSVRSFFLLEYSNLINNFFLNLVTSMLKLDKNLNILYTHDLTLSNIRAQNFVFDHFSGNSIIIRNIKNCSVNYLRWSLQKECIKKLWAK